VELAGATEQVGLPEAARLAWRKPATPRTLRRDGRRWTLWTSGVVATFTLPSLVVVALEPLTFPIALLWSAHGWAVCRMQAGRGARAVVPLGPERTSSEKVALGLLGDLLGHRQRDSAARTGLVPHQGRHGLWLVGQQGAMMIRPGGRRIDCWCVRVGEAADLPAGDRVAHLLLALREDELGFATVANMNFSGAPRRVRRRMAKRQRPALDAALAAAR
jgi:hypothetical protein